MIISPLQTDLSLFLADLVAKNLQLVLDCPPVSVSVQEPTTENPTDRVFVDDTLVHPLEEAVQPMALVSQALSQVLPSPSDLPYSSESFSAPPLVALLESLQPAL